MAETTFSSPGVTTREIDLSAPSKTGPSGVPAGVIGTADEGRAFVPVLVGDIGDFESRFGKLKGDKFGPLAAQQWLTNARSLSYVRVLGAGNAKQRSTTDGTVTNAGFVVGQREPLESGLVGHNPHANEGGPLGRTYFLGCFMSQSAGSTIFSDAGIQILGDERARPILRGVLFAASGVVPTLSSSNKVAGRTSVAPSPAAVSTTLKGGLTGTVNIGSGKQEFVMLLNGHKNTPFKNVITASFNPIATNYFGNVFNSDPEAVQKHGYVLYTQYDVDPSFAAVTGTECFPVTGTALPANYENAAFLTTSSLGRNAGSAVIPNYENFQERFAPPHAPFVISQTIGGKRRSLFRVHALADGAVANQRYKISIENVAKSSDPNNNYGQFDLVVRDFNDTDKERVILEQWRGLNLDPTSDNFIARRIGDQHIFYDFDRAQGSQKIVVQGNFPNVSNLIRVSLDAAVANGDVADTALPLGFRGPDHLITSGANILTAGNWNTNLQQIVEPPVPLRISLNDGASAEKKVANKAYYWGVQFERRTSTSDPNKDNIANKTIASFTGFFPNFVGVSNQNFVTGNNPNQADSSGVILDCDRFNNNVFSFENVKVVTGSDGLMSSLDSDLTGALYVRKGNIVANAAAKTRAFSVDDTAKPAIKRLTKFSFFLQGGFDGVDIFDAQSAKLSNVAVKGEADDATRGLTLGSATAAYRKAADIMGEKSDVEIQLLAVPGIRHSNVTNHVIDVVEDRFDALYLMDIEERDEINSVVTSSVQNVHVGNTVQAFADRALDTSFAAAYFPDVNINAVVQTSAGTGNTIVQAPPSVAALGAFSYNDAVSHPWFAPAGFSRGAVNALSTAVSLNRSNLDDLYNKDINPIVKFPSTGPIIYGQKTLQAAQSALDRVNVRRLLIDIRRNVKRIAESLLFEPNREATLARFSALVTPILQRVQQEQGIDRFKVVIDTSTTTQADIENNTVRGKIFLQPTRSIEFISIDFVVTNAGAEGL
jgi:phage tail sheath protein FI